MFNSIRILIYLAMIGCASGEPSDPTNVDVEIDTISVPRKPVSSQQEAEQSLSDDRQCEVVQTAYGNNCVLKIIKCTDGTMDSDSYCYGPPYVPPWKWIPDPPYKGNYNE